MKEERNIITIDKYGSISLPTDIGATAMTEWEICELFGVIAPTVRAGIKALCKSGVLREYDIKRTVRISDEYSAEVYNLETIAALAFRVESFGAAKVRKALLDRIMHGRKEKTTVFVSVVTDTEPPMDGVTVSRSGYQSVIQSYGHTFIRSYRHTDGKGAFPDRRQAEQSFPFTKAKQARGFPSASRSGGCAIRGTISTLILRVVFFP